MGKVLNFSLATKIREFTDVLSQNVINELEDISDDYHGKVSKSVLGEKWGTSSNPNTGKQKRLRAASTNKGTLPIPVLHGKLSQNTVNALKKVDDLNYQVLIDGRRVEYARYIHDGTESIRPRPFLKWIMRDNKPTYIKRLKGVFKASRRQVGIRLDGK